jgi:hypothetical protein
MGLARFEKRLERTVEGAFARAFKGQVRPVEIARRLIREMDLSVEVGVKGQRLAPNHFTVALSTEDVARLGQLAGPLAAELAEEAEAHADDEGYALVGPCSVDLVEDTSQRPGIVAIESAFQQGHRTPRPIAYLTDGTANRYPIVPGVVLQIGRMADCHIVVNDTNVSRRHAEVHVERDGIRLVDLGSLNGTKVNGRGVPPKSGTQLHEGDEILVGNGRFVVVGTEA